MKDYVNTADAAKIIGCSVRRVRQLVNAKKLACFKMGRDWLVEKKSAKEYAKSVRKPGPKPKDDSP